MSTRDPVSADQLEVLAKSLEAVCQSYRSIASQMRDENVEVIELTGMKTAVGRSLELLRGHARRASLTVARELDARVDALLSEHPSRHVVDDTQNVKPTRKAKKPRE